MRAPAALWALVRARLPPSERPAARMLLGPEGLERCAELRAEAETLHGLWQELRAARRPDRHRERDGDGDGDGPPGAGAARALLGAPGPLKELLRDELRALLLRLRRRAARGGRDPDEAIAKYGPRVLRFAWGDAGGCPVPNGASPGPSLAQRLEPLCDHLSIARLPEVLPQLRALLAEEHRALEELVAHLQRCLEDEHRAATGSPEPEPEPTMAELQEQRRAMERDLQQGQPAPAHSHGHRHTWGAKPSMTPAPPTPPR
ncbi:coiled-coil domain-containing protein 24 [Alligator mississippiensis]|uniref:coiled-coil domain-containing protein 24 n=1 Tax=Alligator mississippiensis TaxID=8496 RepID=UPI002877EB8E|nr:coiled-coil domain-containing protein 24 [Alligator mississippiensis]